MKGLRLTPRLITHPVVAKTKATARNGPSGRNTQAKVASPAMASSTLTPARSIAMRSDRFVSFQESVTSVYGMGVPSITAMPMLCT